MQEKEDDRVFAGSQVHRVSDRGQDRDRSEYMMNQGRRHDNPCLSYSMLTLLSSPTSKSDRFPACSRKDSVTKVSTTVM